VLIESTEQTDEEGSERERGNELYVAHYEGKMPSRQPAGCRRYLVT